MRVAARTAAALILSLAMVACGAPAHRTPTPATYSDVAFTGADRGWIAGYRCAQLPNDCTAYLWTTTDGGKAWREQKLGAGRPRQVTWRDATNGWVLLAAGTTADSPCPCPLLATGDGGKTWSERYRFPADRPATQVTFGSSGRGYTVVRPSSDCPEQVGCGAGNQLLTTADGGRTWSELPVPGYYPATPAFLTATTGWLSAWHCADHKDCRMTVLKTHDGGSTWTQQLQTDVMQSNNGGGLSVAFRSEAEGWARLPNPNGCSHGGCWGPLLHTTDGGTTWAPSQTAQWSFMDIMQGPPGSPGEIHFVSSDAGLIPVSGGGAGTSRGGVAITSDGGRTWERVSDDWNLAALAPTGSGGAWAVGTGQADSTSFVVHSTDRGKTWEQVKVAG